MSKDRLAELAAALFDAMDLSVCDGCDACALRCTEGVPMSRREYDAVVGFLREDPNAAQAGWVTTPGRPIDFGEGVVAHRCRFHDDEAGRCRIYPVRPLVCRLMGHVEWMPCPVGKVARPVDTPLALELLSVYAADERRTFDEWERNR